MSRYVWPLIIGIALYPANATFRYHFGVALLEKGNKTEAGAHLKQALSEKPSDEVRHGIEAALARTV